MKKLKVSNMERAEVLTQALPHIKKYTGETIVIKYGGNAMIREDLKEQVMEDIVLLQLIGVNVVLVHGGGPDVSEAMEKMGKKPAFVDGLRVTDKETIEIVQMVLAGKVNKTLVNLLEMKGGRAMGISGIDGSLLRAHMKNEQLGYVGRIDKVNIGAVTDLLEQGYIPVVSSIAWGHGGKVFNINADTAAAYIAGALGAKRMIMLTDIDGILLDKDDPDTLISEISVDELQDLFETDRISGGMIPKVESCVEAIEMGADKATILDGRIPHSILMELLTNEGAGTMITPGTGK
ncbi:MAG: acetylglutamate kinase [Lachnospiraceae bacterium]|nr:acetylglutamate kinase [Lachnospiraceae bacterium]